jgi:hypothetical protein
MNGGGTIGVAPIALVPGADGRFLFLLYHLARKQLAETVEALIRGA